MSNDVGRARSNYFHVREPDAFHAALAAASPDLRVWTHGEGTDPSFVAVCSDDPDTGSWPSGHYDADDEWVELDLVALIAPHLREGEVAVLMEAGFQKLRYVFGHAVAFNNSGESVQLNLNQIYEQARPLGHRITHAEY